MIPLGNWADRIDELESENFDLVEELGRAEDEISDYLFEIDTLRDRVAALEDENSSLRKQRNDVLEDAYHDWARANDLETYSVSIEEAQKLQKRNMELELDVEGLLALVEYWQEKAAEAADDVSYWIDSSREADEFSYEQQARLDAVEERAGSWFEVAKKLVRSRNAWMRVANRDLELRYQVEQELSELKKALRTLSQ